MYLFGLKSTYLKNDDWVPKQLKDISQIYSNPNKMLKDVFAEYEHGGQHRRKWDELGLGILGGEWRWEQAGPTLLYGFIQNPSFIYSFLLFQKISIFAFKVKYSFEKTALIVTINKCSNLPAKDSTNKTR